MKSKTKKKIIKGWEEKLIFLIEKEILCMNAKSNVACQMDKITKFIREKAVWEIVKEYADKMNGLHKK